MKAFRRLAAKAEQVRLRAQRFRASTLGRIRGNRLFAFWSVIANFGDLLTPWLLRKYGFTPVHAFPHRAQIVAAGSLLQHLDESYSGAIVGTGLIDDRTCPLPRARIHALRGPLTAARVRADSSVPFGDPGLLASRFVSSDDQKKHVLGLIPHYVDKEDPRLERIRVENQGAVNLIDVQRKPRQVCRDIASCQYILSSSLHGIVVADSFGIPCTWVKLSDRVIGDGFKFRDYHAALGIEVAPITLDGSESLATLVDSTRPTPDCVEDKKVQLHQLFASLKESLLD